MECYLEHANLTVRNIDATVRFLQTAFPEFRIRGTSDPSESNRWVHVGTDSSYLALTQAHDGASALCAGTPGFNHLGYVVDDADGLRARMLEAGYDEGYRADVHPYRKRVYILDDDGMEWEFVEYLSDDPLKRNAYDIQVR